MKRKFTISLNEWVFQEMLKGKMNKSSYIEELLIKNHIEKLKSDHKTKETNPSQFFSWNAQAQNLLAKL